MIRQLISELGFLDQNVPTTLLVDNQFAILILKNDTKGKTKKEKKHIEIPRKFIQHHMGFTVELKQIKSQDQLEDKPTKPLSRKI